MLDKCVPESIHSIPFVSSSGKEEGRSRLGMKAISITARYSSLTIQGKAARVSMVFPRSRRGR